MVFKFNNQLLNESFIIDNKVINFDNKLSYTTTHKKVTFYFKCHIPTIAPHYKITTIMSLHYTYFILKAKVSLINYE